jgi:hypothetical protein
MAQSLSFLLPKPGLRVKLHKKCVLNGNGIGQVPSHVDKLRFSLNFSVIVKCAIIYIKVNWRMAKPVLETR